MIAILHSFPISTPTTTNLNGNVVVVNMVATKQILVNQEVLPIPFPRNLWKYVIKTGPALFQYAINETLSLAESISIVDITSVPKYLHQVFMEFIES